MRFLLVIHESSYTTHATQDRLSPSLEIQPETLLECNGYQVFTSCEENNIQQVIQEVDAAVLNLPLADINAWEVLLKQWRNLPLLWWCSTTSATSSISSCEADVNIDGILTPSMSEQELHWALHFGAKQFYARQHWHDERLQLLTRIEERKWIDMAKQILSDMNRISEAEAYDILRKRAMNERKRMVDISTSIVKAHQTLKA
ncbi:response regulator NasT [Paenibacillus sp. DS2015]|uniref:ANTAR domain-containing response regulator n=1 Tax=Paenibacillus sp. DS2015 TaxID=3373917 RepID=UPI003D20394F